MQHQCKDTPVNGVLSIQVVHSRSENAEFKVKSAGFLSKSQLLEVRAVRDIAAGTVISIDYAPDKVESQVCPNILLS